MTANSIAETGTVVPIQAQPAAVGAPATPNRHDRAEARTPPPLLSVGDELTLRAGLDAAWDAVLAVYLAGLAEWPDPFQPRKPTPRPPA